MNEEYRGKTIFFLYPLSVIEELAKELVRNEFEVYLINDKDIMIELLKLYDKSILYINIDETSFNEKEWENYILNIKNDEVLNKKVDIGLLTYKRNEDLIRKYLFDIGIKCGYIELNLKLADTIDIMLKTLEANEARGRRKYVRVICGKNIKFNIEIKDPNSTFNKFSINGIINNISSFGFAGKIIDEKYKDLLSEKLKFNSIQLNLKGLLCTVSCEIILKRDDIYIFKFDPSLNPFIKNKIYQFIFKELQNNINSEIKIIKKNLEDKNKKIDKNNLNLLW